MVYVDTSALAKWYLNERGSEDFVDWLVDQSEPWISTLTAVELRCLFARKQRNREISLEISKRAYATFEEDTARGHLYVHPLEDDTLRASLGLIGRFPKMALRTLDAIHLSVARELAVPALATADRVMGDAAEALDLEVIRFGQ